MFFKKRETRESMVARFLALYDAHRIEEAQKILRSVRDIDARILSENDGDGVKNVRFNVNYHTKALRESVMLLKAYSLVGPEEVA